MEPIHSNSPPNNPIRNQIWYDTSVVPNRQFRWNGSNWIPITGNVQSHALLSNLSYDDAGHTGFAPTRHSHFLSELEGADDVIKQIQVHPESGPPINGTGVKSGDNVDVVVENDTQLVRFDAVGLANAEHPHEQNDIAGLGVTLQGKTNRIDRGQPGGHAPLDSSGKIPIQHIPSAAFGGSSDVPTHTHPSYAEKNALSSQNGAQTVHYTNLRGVPAFGHENYKGAVEFTNQLPTSNNTDHDIRLVTSQGLLYWWDGLQWNQIGFLNFTHSQLNGNGADDHPQYFNEERGDTRYYTKLSANTTFATKEEVSALSGGPSLQQTYPLQDDQSSAIGTGYTLDMTTYRGSSLMYMVERGVSLVFGTLNLAHVVNAPYISDARDVMTSDVEVTFTATVAADTLVLNYTSTSTGEAPTLRICEKIKFYR